MIRRPFVIGVAGLAGGALCAGVFRRRRSAYRGAAASPPAHTRAVRNLDLARVGGRVGRGYALLRARRVFARAGSAERLTTEFQLRSAGEIAAAFGSMKGALMKFGQMVSYVDQGLPEPVRQAMATLQDNAPPMTAELAAEVIRAELGKAPNELFHAWDPRPIAAASIGQVHRAITRDGKAVAVKVQYPGVDDAIRDDLDNARFVLRALGTLLPRLETQPLADEIRARGHCCVEPDLVARDERGPLPALDDSGKFVERRLDTPMVARFDAEFIVAATDVLHERVAAHDHAGAVVAFESAHRSEACLQTAVVGFDPVVRVLGGVVKRGRDQLFDRSS